jgi:hypothetical protein
MLNVLAPEVNGSGKQYGCYTTTIKPVKVFKGQARACLRAKCFFKKLCVKLAQGSTGQHRAAQGSTEKHIKTIFV